jgi:hypothetical protein
MAAQGDVYRHGEGFLFIGRGRGLIWIVAGTDFGKESSSKRPKSLISKIQPNGDKIC